MSLNCIQDDPAELLAALVGLPSVNPVYGGGGEAAVRDFVMRWLGERGLEPQIWPVAPGRDNVVARIGPKDAPAVLLEAHMDTVGVAGWAEGSPFALRREGSRLYGRGACDTKASLACFMLAAARLSQVADRMRYSLVFAATVDEENEQAGAYALANRLGEFGARWAISGEPTRSRIVARHKGICRYRILARGVAAHGSTPELGDNAILKAARACGRLEALSAALAAKPRSREIERGTLNVGGIRGGVGFNVVPDSCEIDLDRRLGVGETAAESHEQLARILALEEGLEWECLLERPALVGAASAEFVGELLAAGRRAGVASEEIEVAYMTNAVAYEAAGVPSVVIGPGDIAQAHKVDEFIEIGEMERCLALLEAFFLGEDWGSGV